MCSGDSFTLGLAVADEEVWCARLAGRYVETVNLGQGGYGIDQAYLWYRRAAGAIEHDVHIFGFVTHDFARMAMTRFIGYAKPRLVVHGDSLRAVGVPVPRRDRARKLRRLGAAIQSLRTAQLTGGLTRRAAAGTGRSAPSLDTARTRDVFTHIVADLKRINERKQSRLLLLYLPSRDDLETDASLAWRTHVRHVADSLGVVLIDLIPQIRQRRDAHALYFHAEHERRFVGATDHFNAEGNRWVSEAVREHLDRLALLVPNPAGRNLSLGSTPAGRPRSPAVQGASQ